LLADKLDIYEAGFDEEFPDARAEWTRAVARKRNIQAWKRRQAEAAQ
jgi:hypothetical protein